MEDYKQKYEEALKMARHYLSELEFGDTVICVFEDIFPELKESDDEMIRKGLIGHLKECRNNTRSEVMLGEYAKWISWLEKQGKKTEPIECFNTEFERQISHLIASTINKEHEYNEGFVKWVSNSLLNYAKHEFEKQGEQKPADLPKGEDYGIDSLYHAARILEKTLGEVDGYQSDDGILEHKCAIEAVNRLYKQKPAWSYEDEKTFNTIIEKGDLKPSEIEWLKSLKERYTWKPSDEQIEALLKLEEMHVLEHEKNQENAHLYMVVKSIREQLLKLMEE